LAAASLHRTATSWEPCPGDGVYLAEDFIDMVELA
jgi:hypothetical protein